MKPGKKLAQAISNTDLTKAEFARLMKVEPQVVNNWLSRGISAKVAFRAARLLGCDAEWLLLDDADLEPGFTPEDQAEIDQAARLFELLSDEEAEAVESLVRLLASK
mgnify:CR=1 FL=1